MIKLGAGSINFRKKNFDRMFLLFIDYLLNQLFIREFVWLYEHYYQLASKTIKQSIVSVASPA